MNHAACSALLDIERGGLRLSKAPCRILWLELKLWVQSQFIADESL